jgi:26S proteasome regulatory subunit T6
MNIAFSYTNIYLLYSYYIGKIEELEITLRDKAQNLERLKAQRNELNGKVRVIREELFQLHEPGSYIGEVVKAMGKLKVLVKINPDGKYVVDLADDIDINKCTPNTRVALKSDSFTLHKILPTRVDPLVSLMKVMHSKSFYCLLCKQLSIRPVY